MWEGGVLDQWATVSLATRADLPRLRSQLTSSGRQLPLYTRTPKVGGRVDSPCSLLVAFLMLKNINLRTVQEFECEIFKGPNRSSTHLRLHVVVESPDVDLQ